MAKVALCRGFRDFFFAGHMLIGLDCRPITNQHLCTLAIVHERERNASRSGAFRDLPDRDAQPAGLDLCSDRFVPLALLASSFNRDMLDRDPALDSGRAKARGRATAVLDRAYNRGVAQLSHIYP